MTQTFVRNRVTWLAYLLLAFYSYFLNVFGPITPFLKDELKLSYTVSSFHFSAFALGIIAAGLAGHLIIQKIGRWRALWVGAFGMSLSAILLSAGRTSAVTIGASFLMGLIGSLILAVIPSTLADLYGEMRSVAISEANVVSSLVSAAAPLLVGWFAPTIFGWRAALIITAITPLLMLLGLGRIHIPSAAYSTNPDLVQPPLPALYWIYWSAIVLSVSIEFCMIFWSADFLEKGLGMPKASAAQAVSLFLVGMIAGRLAGSRLVQRFNTHKVVTSSLLVAAVGFLLYWTAAAPIFGAVGLFLTGLGIACLYPLILSLAIGSAQGNTVQASARSSLASGAAIFTLPLVLGRLADAVGIRQAYGVIILLLVGVFLIVQFTSKKVKSSEDQYQAAKSSVEQ